MATRYRSLRSETPYDFTRTVVELMCCILTNITYCAYLVMCNDHHLNGAIHQHQGVIGMLSKLKF